MTWYSEFEISGIKVTCLLKPQYSVVMDLYSTYTLLVLETILNILGDVKFLQ